MNVFEEFKHLALELEKQGVRYALTGGVAMAFYAEPRFTRDIDLLVDEAESEEGKVMVVNRKDLIWLKSMRDSKQDQADIEKLENDKNR